MDFFHRQAKSEGDVSALLAAGVFMPPLDPTYAIHSRDSKIIELETQLAFIKDERSLLEQDLDDYRTDLFHARTELYSAMLRNARHEQHVMDDFRAVQKLEARHQRFCSLLVDIGIPRPVVDVVCDVIQSGHGSPEDILVDAIKDAANDDNTILARLKPIIRNERTPQHYQSALNMTLSIRKELKSQKKRSKFWKKLAQEGDRHADTATPSPSDLSPVRRELPSARQDALDAFISHHHATKCSDIAAGGDVFGGLRRESTLDTLAGFLASRPRRSIQEDLRLSSSFSSSSASSASTTYHPYLSGHSRLPRGPTTETSSNSSRLPSSLSTSLRHSFRSSTESVVLGNMNLNVSRSSSIDPTVEEESELQVDTDNAPASATTLSQDLPQNTRRPSQGNGHRRMSSATSRRSVPTRSTRSSFRLSAFSPFRAFRNPEPSTVPDSDVSQHTTIDTPSFITPNIMRLSDFATSTDTDVPASSTMTASSQGTPFSDPPSLPKCDTDRLFSLMDLESQMASTPLGVPVACKHLGTRFLEHIECDGLLSTSVSASESGVQHIESDGNHHHHIEYSQTIDLGTDTIPIGESKDSLFTTSASSLSTIDTPAPTTPVTPLSNGSGTGISPGTRKASIGQGMLPMLAKHLRRLSLSGRSPEREVLVARLRGLRSLSRSRSKSRSGAGSESESDSDSDSTSGSGSRIGSASGSGSESVSGSPPPSVWQGSPETDRSERLTVKSGPSQIKVPGNSVSQRQRGMTIRAQRMTARMG